MGNYKIYKYTSPSGGVYIGQTHNTIERRAGGGGYQYLNRDKKTGDFNQPAIAKAIIKYGWDNFQKEVIYSGLTSQEADEKEKELIREYREKGECYNISDGGKNDMRGVNDHRVLQYSLDGEFIKTWDSIKEACETLYGNYKAQANIVRCCKGRSHRAYGYIWKYAESDEEIVPVSPYRAPICQFNKKTGEYIATFPTIRAASKATGIGETSIGNNLRGWSGSAGGFLWRFESLA